MPNHITNILTVEGENPQAVLDYIYGGEEEYNGEKHQLYMDFNRVVQMPELLEGDLSSIQIEQLAKLFCGHIDMKALFTPPQPVDAKAQFEAHNYGPLTAMLEQQQILRLLLETKMAGGLKDEDFEKLVKYMRCLRQFGHCSWYEWSREHWGTKWNAYDQEKINDTTIKFDTAWCTPGPIWEKLSEKFPENILHIRYADEDFGCNTGNFKLLNGEVIEGEVRIKNQSPEAYKNAVDVCYDGELPDYMYWNDDGTVGWRREEEEEELEN